MSAKHKNKFKTDRQIFFTTDKCFSRCTNVFRVAQISFAINKTFSLSTNFFRDAQIFFAIDKIKPIDKSFSQSTNLCHDAQVFFAIDKTLNRSTKLLSDRQILNQLTNLLTN